MAKAKKITLVAKLPKIRTEFHRPTRTHKRKAKPRYEERYEEQ